MLLRKILRAKVLSSIVILFDFDRDFNRIAFSKRYLWYVKIKYLNEFLIKF